MNRNRQKYYYHSQAIYRAPIMCKSYLVSIVRHRNVRQCPCSERERWGGRKEGGRASNQCTMVVFTLDLMSAVDNVDFKELK